MLHLILHMPPRSTKEDFIIKAIAIHGDQYDYSAVEYKNNATYVNIKCLPCGKVNQITPNKHLAGRGCSTNSCKSLKQSIAQTYSHEKWIKMMQEIHGDKYDYSETNYIDSRSDVTIFCNGCSEYFTQNSGSHRRGHGCPTCGGTKKLTHEEWVERVRIHHPDDTLDLSNAVYVNCRTQVSARCIPCNFIWNVNPKQLAQGHGCPYCCQSKSEKTCRKIFQELMGAEFKPGYPDFLRGETKLDQQELDGYYPEIKLAWEYQGIQHTEFVPHWHKNEEGFLKQKQRDQKKKYLCEINNVTLIEIPHTYNFRDPTAIKQFIYNQLVLRDFIVEFGK